MSGVPQLVLIALASALWGLAVWIHARVTGYALKHFGRSRLSAVSLGRPPLSILKPIKGVIPSLAENLESFMRLDYPDFEIIFSVASENDPAVPVIRGAMAAYPHVDARLLVSPEGLTGNPKFSTLLIPFALAKHDWCLISDANVRVCPDFLERMTSYLDDDVGIVAAVPAGVSPQGIGGYLDAVYLNTFYARGVLLCAMSGKPVTPGKAQLFQRSVAMRFGGLNGVGRHLGADVLLGKQILRLGLRAVIMREPAEQVNGYTSLGAFWSRHLRWGRVRRSFHPPLFVLEPFLSSLGSGLIGAWAASRMGFGHPFCFLALHLTFWGIADWLVMRRIAPATSSGKSFLAWIAREALSFPLWLHSAVGNTALWSGAELRMVARRAELIGGRRS